MLEALILAAGAVIGFAIGWTLGYRKGINDDARMRAYFVRKQAFQPLALHEPRARSSAHARSRPL
jgi:hypothetical protein